jgi:membrane protein YfhO
VNWPLTLGRRKLRLNGLHRAPTGATAPAATTRSQASPWRVSARLAGVLVERGWPLPLLAGVTLVVFWQDLFGGQAYYGSDTLAFYHPLTVWYAEQLRSGHLPLWFGYIFGGYPLFADGEIGMLYPLNLLAYLLLPIDSAFVLLRPLHFLLAGVFTYWLGRLIGLQRFGALLTGLSFAYGSFMVGHLQHENIIRSTVWLPLELALLELAFRRIGRRRLLPLLGCGLVLGVQMLGIHVQPVLLSLLVLPAYACCAPLRPDASLPPPALPSWRRALAIPRSLPLKRLVMHLWPRLLAVGLVTIVGSGLAAVQLLPLYQLGERSMRSGGVSYDYSTSFSVPPVQLLQLVLPYLFRPDGSSYWGLWSAAETTIYLGVAPLLLALVALAYLRSRPVGFFGLLFGLSLLLALGDYLPVKLYSLVWSLPGFSYLRVPARFGMVFTLSAALLAGFAADWLASRSFDRSVGSTGQTRLKRLTILLSGCSLGALLLGVLFWLLRGWLYLDPGGTRQAIETYYLSARRGDGGLSESAVYFGLLHSVDLSNPRTLGGLLLMLAAALLLALRGLHRLPRRLWQTALVLLIAVDLTTFAQGFNPRRPVEALRLWLPSTQFLADQAGLQRVFVEPQLYGLLGPNQLVGSGIDFAGGYSSLEPRRATEYWWSIVRQDNLLLDLFNVRYVVSPHWTPGTVSYDGDLFHPGDRLMRGATGNPSGTETFKFSGWWTEAVSVVASGERFKELPYGEPVAEITVAGPAGQQRVVLRAGIDVEDGAEPPLGPELPGTAYAPKIVWTGASFQHPGQLSALSGATLPLEHPQLATSLTFRRIGPANALDLYGLGLRDRPGVPVRSITPVDRLKYELVYQDQDVNIYENQAALPRAFVVGSAQEAQPGSSTVDQMLLGNFDPRHTVLLDEPPPTAPSEPSNEVGRAEISSYGPDRVVVNAEAPAPGYLVLSDRYEENWQATVDGVGAPLLRADSMFRAVPLPTGRHQVEFTYRPFVVLLGAGISLVTLALVGLAALFCWRGRPG